MVRLSRAIAMCLTGIRCRPQARTATGPIHRGQVGASAPLLGGTEPEIDTALDLVAALLSHLNKPPVG